MAWGVGALEKCRSPKKAVGLWFPLSLVMHLACKQLDVLLAVDGCMKMSQLSGGLRTVIQYILHHWFASVLMANLYTLLPHRHYSNAHFLAEPL